jgi:hypothetical protein
MLTKKTFSSLLLLTALASCAHVKIPDTEACAVAGTMAAGMNCATTLSLKTREMDLDETLEFLEAQEAIKDENGKIIKEAHSAAICQSSKDYVSLKTALEQACIIMKKRCTYEFKQMIKKMGNVIALISPDTKKTSLVP